MTTRLVDSLGPEHRCDLPKQGLFPNLFPWTRNPLCVEGNIIQCEVCGKKYKWTWSPYSAIWDWDRYVTKEDIQKAMMGETRD